MTRDEAIAELQADKALYETDICHADDGSPDGRLIKALDMAVEALCESVADDTTRLGREYIAQDIQNKKGFIIGHHCREIIVRCKDCKYYKQINPNSEHGLCHKDIVASVWHDTGFCSRGERRQE